MFGERIFFVDVMEWILVVLVEKVNEFFCYDEWLLLFWEIVINLVVGGEFKEIEIVNG